jgi:hypothetical protein
MALRGTAAGVGSAGIRLGVLGLTGFSGCGGVAGCLTGFHMVLSKSFPPIHRWGIVTSALGNNELDAALFIGCLGSREIEIAKGILHRLVLGEHP